MKEKFNAEKLKELWAKLKERVGKVSKKVWIIAAIVIVALAAGLTIYLNTRPYSVLITGATASEVATVTNWLEERGIKTYRYQGTDTILVPEGQALALKASLLAEMYQDGSSDYSGYFDNVSMLSTEKERSNAWLIALQQKMESVIRSFDGVQDAQVTISPGEDRGYVLDSSQIVESSASVKVTMRAGRTLSNAIASAIRGYVSGGVQGLKIESVQVYDSYGNHYNAGAVNAAADSEASALKLQLEQEYANKIRTEVMNLLLPIYGEKNVQVATNVVIELGDSTIDEFDTWIPEYVEGRVNGQGIIGSRVYAYEYSASDNTNAGGLVYDPDVDIATNVEREPGTVDVDGKVSGSGQQDYRNPTRTTHTVRTAGYVADCTVSVSVNSAAATQPIDIEGLRQHVALAAGITGIETETMTAAEYLASKVSIYAAPFVQGSLVPEVGLWARILEIVPWWVFLAAAGGLLLFIILLAVILSLRKRSRKRREAEEAERLLLEQQNSMEALLAAGVPQLEPVGADVMSLQTEKSLELRQDIRQFAEENPEVAAQLIKTWLRGGDENG